MSKRTEEVLKRFDLYWGTCPEGTPKYKAREKAKRFFEKELKVEEVLIKAIAEKVLIKTIKKW